MSSVAEFQKLTAQAVQALIKFIESNAAQVEVEYLLLKTLKRTDVFIKINNIKLDYCNTKMKSKIVGFIHEAQ